MSLPIEPPRPLTRTEVREVDRRAIEEFGVPGAVLMENAGLGLTEAFDWELTMRGAAPGGAGIVVGRGNNGGDGLVLARQLQLRGYRPRVVYCGRLAEAPRDTDAGVNLDIVLRAGIEVREAPSAEELAQVLAGWEEVVLLADALFGTGLAQELRPAARALVEVLDEAPQPKVAVDIPSGLDCDRGVPLGAAVRAVRTVTFVGPKQGFLAPGAEAYTGAVQVVPIGCPPQAWDHVR
ncbi:MAG: NAD(P)H-hydrate epimerase [Planctomycetota bacterium]|nr:MAG: NAD(P)H-hydrate epimerase [Planctomycetota bacterium]